jgi:hypothetical protein
VAVPWAVVSEYAVPRTPPHRSPELDPPERGRKRVRKMDATLVSVCSVALAGVCVTCTRGRIHAPWRVVKTVDMVARRYAK